MANNISFEAVEPYVRRPEGVPATGRCGSPGGCSVKPVRPHRAGAHSCPTWGRRRAWVEFLRVKNPEELGLIVLLQIIKE
jgi:hypothetical protein